MDYYETKESRLTLSSGHFFYEMILFSIIALAGLLAVSIFSYDPNDPGWTQTTIHQPINNAAGKIGAYTADTIFFLFGAVSYLIPFVLILFSIICWRRVYTDTFINFYSLSFRIIGLFLILVSSCVLAGLNIDDTHSFSSGGIIGNIVIALLFPLLNSVGTTLLMLFIWLISFSLFTRLSPLSIAEKLGEIILITFTLGASRDKNIIDEMNAEDKEDPYAFMDSEQTDTNNHNKETNKFYQSTNENGYDEPYDLVQDSDVRLLTANSVAKNDPIVDSKGNEDDVLTRVHPNTSKTLNTSDRIEPTITLLDDELTHSVVNGFSQPFANNNPTKLEDQPINKTNNLNDLNTKNADSTDIAASFITKSTAASVTSSSATSSSVNTVPNSIANTRPVVVIASQNDSPKMSELSENIERTDSLNINNSDSASSLNQDSISQSSATQMNFSASSYSHSEKLHVPENNPVQHENMAKAVENLNNSGISNTITAQNSPRINQAVNTVPINNIKNNTNTNTKNNAKIDKTDHAVRNKLAAFGIRIPSRNELQARYAEKFHASETTLTTDELNLADTIDETHTLNQSNTADHITNSYNTDNHNTDNQYSASHNIKNNTDLTEGKLTEQTTTNDSIEHTISIHHPMNAQENSENQIPKYVYNDEYSDETKSVLSEPDLVINSASDASSLRQLDEDTLIIHPVTQVTTTENHPHQAEQTNNLDTFNADTVVHNPISSANTQGNDEDELFDESITTNLPPDQHYTNQLQIHSTIANELEQQNHVENSNDLTISFEQNSSDNYDIHNEMDNEIKDINLAAQPDLFHPFLVRGQDEEMEKPTEPLPTLDLLYEAPAQKIEINEEELRNTAQLIENTLADFRIKVTVVEICTGPVITRFELELAPGVKVSRISSLDRDLARALSVSAVRVVEVIPGKPYVGLELPNPVRQTLVIRDVLNCHEFESMKSPLALVLGKDIAGEPVVANLAKMPHLLVAGTTGSGKSVGVNAMIISILYKASPEDVRFIMIDPKMLELSVYEGIPHLLTNVVTDMKDASNALRWCVAEMDRRYKLMAALGVRNLDGYNEKIAQAEAMQRPIPDPFWKPSDSMSSSIPHLIKLPFIVVIVDEFADLMMTEGKKVEELIARLAQKARAAGIHLVLATQRPSVDVITGLIKANIPTRIAFTVSSKIDSRTILDQGGAESLLGAGDMLYLPPNSSTTIRVHGAFVRDEEVHKVVANWKARGKPQYIDAITAGEKSSEGENGENSAEALDPMFDHAVQFVIEKQRVSISGIQRQFRLGYNRAARIVEEMEAQGIVSAPAHNGNREVLAQ